MKALATILILLFILCLACFVAGYFYHKIMSAPSQKLSIVMLTWIANKKACDPIFETISGTLEEARLQAQKIWQAYYPGAAKQIYIYTYGETWLNRKNVLLQANNFDKFESARVEVRKGMKVHARMWSQNL